jgi:hypothetical protein
MGNKLLFFAALLALVACTQAQLIWVRPFGVPCPPGCPVCNGTFTCPVATIGEALTLLPWGGTIRLFSGFYAINDLALTAGSFTILYVTDFGAYLVCSLLNLLNLQGEWYRDNN